MKYFRQKHLAEQNSRCNRHLERNYGTLLSVESLVSLLCLIEMISVVKHLLFFRVGKYNLDKIVVSDSW